MKDSMDATAVGRAVDPEVFAIRKLIRPALNRNEHPRQEAERRERPADRVASNGKQTPPPEQTHAENFYYQKQMQGKTPMVSGACRTVRKYTASSSGTTNTA